jgi:hypothetical protein
MSDQREVLELIARRGREGRSTSFRTVALEFLLSDVAACGRLQRLWRERLIVAGNRPVGFQFRLAPSESVRELRFVLTGRGRERLCWYEKGQRSKDKEEGWLW